MKILSKKTHLGKCTCLCSLKLCWLYIIWVNIKKAHSRKRTQLNGLWIQVLKWENSWMCFSWHNFPHKLITCDFPDDCSISNLDGNLAEKFKQLNLCFMSVVPRAQRKFQKNFLAYAYSREWGEQVRRHQPWSPI